MGDKREFLQRYPPDVFLPLDASSDIHYGKNSNILKFLIVHVIVFSHYLEELFRPQFESMNVFEV